MNCIEAVGSGYRADLEIPKGSTETRQFRLKQNEAPYVLAADDVVTITLIRSSQWLGADEDPIWGPWSERTEDAELQKEVDADAMTIVTPSAGLVAWAPGTTDIDTPGRYYYQVRVQNAALTESEFFPDNVREGRAYIIVTPSLFA